MFPTYRQRAKRIAHRRTLRLITRRALNILAVIVIVGVVVDGLWIWYKGSFEQVRTQVSEWGVELSGNMGLSIQNVYIMGQKNVRMEDIKKALDIEQGQPIFSVSLGELKSRIETVGWIKEARIERELPSTLHITLIEREPVAVWQYQGKVKLVDREGAIITEGTAGAAENFTNLPYIVGEEAHSHIGVLLDFLSSEPELFRKVTAMIRVGNRRWNVRLNNEIEIKLPEDDPDRAWKYLGKLEREKKILSTHIKSIDLRLPDRMFVESPE
ncbi:MAG: FtsQ-type POTRA domain-containing protein [Proteobacteria bacterium]|nr:FtsQ-type POTRA domain-containing protein [Pseudomonadota bacterium]